VTATNTLKETVLKLATALVASILSLTTLAARGALPTDDDYSVTVRFADLDLDHKAGIAKLYVRIRGAARRVCYQQANDEQGANQADPVCVKRAVSTAVARIDRPMLSEYFAQLGGKPAEIAPASVAAR
jgi:UrcA family protein